MLSHFTNYAKNFFRRPEHRLRALIDQVDPTSELHSNGGESCMVEGKTMVTTRRMSLSKEQDEGQKTRSNLMNGSDQDESMEGVLRSGRKRKHDMLEEDGGEKRKRNNTEGGVLADPATVGVRNEPGSQEDAPEVSNLDSSTLPDTSNGEEQSNKKDGKFELATSPEVDVKEAAPKSSTKRRHVRFGSTEPELLLGNGHVEEADNHPHTVPTRGAFEDNNSDSDDAPEAVKNLSELSKRRSEIRKQAEAKDNEKQLLKRRRQEKDARLRTQADASRKKTKAAARNFDDEDEEPEITQQLPTTDPSSSLPALLPDHILNSIPPSAPVKAREDGTFSISVKRRKLHDITTQRTKDVTRGKTTFRVLEVDRNLSTLPPKSSKQSSHIRETWLMKKTKCSFRNPAPSNGSIIRRASKGRSNFLRK